ncbi:hypothetical protein LO772_14850 [Yinghuangia sp. ASG 101]|uniref:hypothetical protein n=1 Tax=Yinghuangia sp. ASG 101 TaxID=2896848 RepID=UPI001E42A827|nr:hypothetical protein [Yinghuangia sp. ASG 101]UGQ14736.1 hypothetical protein LO772_14850 [Yinghuangia sp. ASG 101]
MDIKETNHAWRTMLADGDRVGVEQLLRHDTRLALLGHEWSGSLQTAETAELRGLVLLGGDGGVPLAADSPWRIPASAGLADALEHIWAPVAGNCSGFLTALRAEVLGLALVAMEGRYLLGYLHLADRAGELPRDLKDLAPYTGSNSLTVLWGTAPTHLGPTDVVPLMDEPLPVGVRDLAAVHASLTSFDFDLRLDHFTTTLGATTRADYEGEDPADYDPGEDFVRAVNGEFDRWIQFCTCDSAAEAYFLDMDDRDPHDVPRVALSSINGTSEPPGEPFWDWIDQALPSLLFCV